MTFSHYAALYTFGIFEKPAESQINEGFRTRNDPLLQLVDRAPGLVGRSGYEGDPGPGSWGKQVYPRFYLEKGDGWSPSTLSVWQDLESALAFTYFGLHAEALAHGREWFKKPEWPPYVLWWVNKKEFPNWSDGITRLEHLHDRGPMHYAFNFKNAFDASNNAYVVDRERVKQIAKAVSLG